MSGSAPDIPRHTHRRSRALVRNIFAFDRHTNEATRMSEVTLTPVEPTPDEVQYLEDRIYEYNSSATAIADGELLAFFVRERGRSVAGIAGHTWVGTCELRQFWVDESQRHRGLGTRLFQAAEQEARRRGCTQIVLMTFSFQAPAFYEKHGFEVIATIDDHPHGHRNLLMRKRLGPDHATLIRAVAESSQGSGIGPNLAATGLARSPTSSRGRGVSVDVGHELLD